MNLRLIELTSFLSFIALCVYVNAFKNGLFFKPIIFFICLTIIFISSTLQIIFISKNRDRTQILLILLQILITAILLRLLFISNENLFAGFDPYKEFLYLDELNVIGHWDPINNRMGGYIGSYPVLYLLGIIWSEMLGLNLIVAAKWLTLSFCFLSPVFIFLIGRNRYSPASGLYSCFIFSYLYISLMFHTTFQRESISVPLMLMALFLLFKRISEEKERILLILTSIIVIVAVSLSHHLTPFILLIFILMLASFSILLPYTGPFLHYLKIGPIKKENVSIRYSILLLAMIIGYWVYLRYSPLVFFGMIVGESNIDLPRTGAVIPSILRYQILYYGDMLFAVLFAILSILAIYLRHRERTVSDIALLFYSGFIGIIMIIALSGHLLPGEGMGLGSRFETFVYIGFSILSGYTIYRFNNLIIERRKYLLSLFIILLLVSFALFNVFRIPVDLYSQKEEFRPGEARQLATMSEVHAITWLGIRNLVLDSSLNGALNLIHLREGTGHAKQNMETNYLLHSKIAPYYTIDYLSNTLPINLIYDNSIAKIYLFKKDIKG
jgi:hypothetical protein